MTAATMALIRDVESAGGHLAVNGDRLRVTAPEPLSDALVDALRQHKTEVLKHLAREDSREAIIKYDADVPRDWAEGFAQLCTMSRHPDFTKEHWQTLIDDAGMFMDRWAVQVAAMGWSTREVFGVHPDKPDARIDFQGLVPCIGGNKVVVVSADSVTIQTPTGARQRIFRRPDEHSEGRVLIWDVEGDEQRG